MIILCQGEVCAKRCKVHCKGDVKVGLWCCVRGKYI